MRQSHTADVRTPTVGGDDGLARNPIPCWDLRLKHAINVSCAPASASAHDTLMALSNVGRTRIGLTVNKRPAKFSAISRHIQVREV